VIILGPYHQALFHGASVWNAGSWKTPLGDIPVDVELANAILQENKDFQFIPQAHLEEQPTSNAPRQYNLDTLLGIQPDCLFADRAGINTVTAIDAMGAKARFVIDHRQTDLNLIDGSFLQRTAWTYLHTCE
jgi:hypothetical protein